MRGNFPLDGDKRYDLDSSILSPRVARFVCFLSAQDVLVERREVTIVSGGQKEKMAAVTG